LKLLLQPLVENAIYHGVRSLKDYNGLITVRGYRSQGTICFEVLDNGRGMPPGQVSSINAYLREGTPPEQEKHGFGLRNVHERIVLAFGQEYGLGLQSELGKGTKVLLSLPLLVDERSAP
ncbi:MAG TPA: histidine kinase, partial [Firmicutes bacterium]|nr:histidine kinase [Bacillota bacterium]